MDKLKKEQTALRSFFTKSIRQMEEKLEKGSTADSDLVGIFEALQVRHQRLVEIGNQLLGILLDSDTTTEDDIAKEMECQDKYSSKWYAISRKFESEQRPRSTSAPGTVKSISHRSETVKIKLPKLELPKFDGNIKNWIGFWGQFKRIDENNGMDDGDKFQYLLQSMTLGTCARQLVESYPPSAGNYRKAVEALKTRFARDDLLIEAYVRGLLNLILEKQRGESDNLSQLYDSLQTHLQALETLGVTKDRYASILFPMIESSLPEDLLRTWNRIRSKQMTVCDDLSNLINFLKQEVESEERIRLAREGFTKMSDSVAEPKLPTACFTSNATKSNGFIKKLTISCIWCNKETHASSECHKASKMTLSEKQDFLKSKKACLICFRTNHVTKKCRSSAKCLVCKRRHLTIMCPEIEEKEEKKTESSTKRSPSSSPSSNINLLSNGQDSTTLLQTLVCKIAGNNQEVQVRILLDSGAQRSYIRTDLAKKLNLKSEHKETIAHCLFGGHEMTAEEYDVFSIRLISLYDSFFISLKVIGQQNICGFLPKITSIPLLDTLKKHKIRLTETTDSTNDVDILIGADYLGTIMTGEILHISNNLMACRTKLGWTVSGRVTGIYNSLTPKATVLHSSSKLPDLWSLESLGITDPSEQASKMAHEKEVLEHFHKTVAINKEGRYEVSLPWKDMPRPKPNYQLAKKRLIATTVRLKSLNKINEYDAVFKEWKSLGIIEEAPQSDIEEGTYIPHHAVFKMSSATTKIRPVFDASAKDQDRISLNICLEKGVNLIELIPELLINFRKGAYAVTADIAKAFLQISLNPEDRNYLKFLWWSNVNDENKQVITFRHKRVVFGLTSSPFHLAATINHHLDNTPPHLKDTAMLLGKSFYVDNCLMSLDTEQDMHRFIVEAKELMALGKFDLRCWVSAPAQVDEEVEISQVLGMVWNVKADTFNCRVVNNLGNKITKREILSIAQKIFDPIGILCPITIVPKIILQRSWNRKISWDSELPDDLKLEFKRWSENLHLIDQIKIPRRLTVHNILECCNSLHVFCDASQQAYSVCIFLRSEYKGDIHISLVMAKARVAPVREITIPRLELIAATIAARLGSRVIKKLCLPNCRNFFWTDSSVALSWIKGDGNWTVFVANRVKEIRSITDPNAWKHIQGHLNPADLPSRGTHIKNLLKNKWWEGPAWLRLEENDWPETCFITNSADVNAERKSVKTNTKVMVVGHSFLNRLTYFSKYTKIVLMVAWMRRLRYKVHRRHTVILSKEFEDAERTVVRLIQAAYPHKLSNLQTFKDDENIIRLSTKLNLGTDNFDFIAPIVLPGNDVIVQRLVEERHRLLLHAGTQTLMANLRETFWIIGIRKLVKKVVRECGRCRRYKATPCQTPLTGLPKDRLESADAFEASGVDLAGPLVLRNGSKCWIVLFTCATYRAVHLELTETLSTNDFNMALRRFTARRGRVRCLFSDNGTNFTGLNNAFSQLDWTEIKKVSAIHRIEWKFIPPAAPWWGGFYERLVGMTKQILRRVLGRASLTLMELQTVLCDCEATINSRPLTYITGGQDELRPLTPSLFIQPRVRVDVADLDTIDRRSLNIRAKYCQKLRLDLRQRFRSEYLSMLVQQKSKKTSQSLLPGDVVLIHTEDKRTNWPLGVILETYPGRDGVCRVAKVRTAMGEKIRAFQKLYPLEVSSSSSDLIEGRVDITDGRVDMTDGRVDMTDGRVDMTNDLDVATDVPRTRTTRSGRTVRPPTRLNI